MNICSRIISAVMWLVLASAGCLPALAQMAPSPVPNLQLADGGTIKAMALQADGKLIVAGRFSAVNGVARRNIARINPNGSVDQTWAPEITSRPQEFDYGILTMCLVGDRLFIGGTFSAVGGRNRKGLAKISTTGFGEPDPQWDPAPSNGGNTAFDYKTFGLVSDGVSLFVGGKFRFIGGQARPGVAKLGLDGTGAAVVGWNPNPATLSDKGITALALDGSFLYAAARNPDPTNRIGDLIRISTGNGAVDSGWHPPVGISEYFIDALVVSATDVFAGGWSYAYRPGTTLPTSNKIVRAMVRKFSVSGSGASDPSWQPAIAGANDADPDTETNVTALGLDGGSLFIGGVFASVGGVARRDMVKVSTSGAGAVDAAWRANADLAKDDFADVEAFIIRGSQVIAGGSFRRINGEVALGIAPIDTLSGALGGNYRAQVQFPAFVTAVARQSDGKLVLGGNFFLANGLVRHGLVRVNTDGSVDEGWQPATEDAQINDIAIVGNDIFVAGTFTAMGGQSRKGLAKLSAIGSDVADPSWDPNVEGYVGAIQSAGSHLYLGGSFNTVGGVAIHGLARVSASGTGALDNAWHPQVSNLREVVCVLVGNDGVFAGSVASQQGASGPSLQKFTLISGAEATAFHTTLTKGLNALALDGSWLYAGGDRTLVRMKSDTGARDSKFNIAPNKDVVTIRISGTKLYAGGIFSRIGGVARAGLARIDTTGNGRVDRDWDPMPQHVESGRPGSLGYFGVLPSIISLRVEGDTVLAGGEYDTIGGEARLSFATLVTAHAPVVVQTPDGIVVSRNPADGDYVTHFRFTRIAGGTLFLHDGVTPITEDDFISVEMAAEGLIFQPEAGSLERPLLVAVSSVNDKPSGAGTDSTFVDLTTLKTLPLFTLDSADYSIAEGTGTIAIEIRKTGNGSGDVDIETSDGSAVAGVHYTAVATRYSFGLGEVSKVVNIPITNDFVFQGDRTFRIALRATAKGAVGGPHTANVKIIDDDAVGATGSRTIISLPNPNTPPASAGEVSVALSPAPANGQWRIVGDPVWHDSGSVVSGLASGNFAVEFRAANGFQLPPPLTVAVVSGQRTNSSATYTALAANSQTGLLTAILTPSASASPATAEASRVQWRRVGEGTWHNSGETVSLNSGIYVVEFKPVSSLYEPPPTDVQVASGQTNSVTGVYVVADTPAAPKPQVLSLSQATTQQPFLFNGQIKSDDTFGSGCVVQTHVVLTAAHVIFDDQSLSFASDVKWFFQRQRGQYESPPQTPRGSYVQEGYAAQRANDGALQEPGISTPASQALDIATLFFVDPPGRGGSSGYLESDASQNEWLTTSRNKILVGYPVGVVPSGDRGKMHATSATNLAFTRLYQAGNPVYATSGIAAYPGTSGGPLCAQYSDGNYYPAAVYLGGTAQTLVRAIDSSAVSLINRAETSGAGGGNNSDGGSTRVRPGRPPIKAGPASTGGATRTETPFVTNEDSYGTISCNLGPPEAIAAGAGWRVASTVPYQGISARIPFPSSAVRIEFKQVPGFIAPQANSVQVLAGQNTVIDGTYRAASAAITSARRGNAGRGEAFQYQITASNGATLYAASNLPDGLTINTQTGLISGIPLKLGTFQVAISAGAASAPLTIIVQEPGTLTVFVSGYGTVTPGFEGTSKRYVGRHYSVTAIPATGMLFDGWSGDKPSEKPTLAFTMENALILRANFVQNPFLTRFGTYIGFLRSAGNVAGIATVSLTSVGKCTMKIVVAGETYSLSDSFDPSGTFAGEIKRRGKAPISIALELDSTTDIPLLTGTFTEDANPLDMSAIRAVFSKTNPALETGKHTLLLPPDAGQSDVSLYPAGHGYALSGIGVNGSIAAVGQLGDGTPFSTHGFVREDHSWALFTQPYRGKGLLAGTLTFTQQPPPDIDEFSGTLHWQKPAMSKGPYALGFSGSIITLGSRWVPPETGNAALTITDWNLAIGNGVLAPPITATATLSPANLFTLTGAPGTKLTLAPKTGLLSGSFPGANGKPVKFNGALLQSQRTGRGVFALPDKTGPVTLDPP